MSINYSDIRDWIIIPTLKKAGIYKDDVVPLLLGTAAAETDFGSYLVQIGGGPALSIFGIEPETYDDNVINYINYRPEFKARILQVLNAKVFPDYSELVHNMALATIMARIKYLRISEPLPPTHNVEAMARYWKKYYNSSKGRGDISDFVNKYNKYVINRVIK